MKILNVYTTIGLIICLIVANITIRLVSQEEVSFTVTDKERIVESNGENTTSRYLIFTDTETFQNSDSLIFGKFNSSDLYGQIKEGETYSAKVCGYRLPFFSTYRNIIKIY